MDNQNTIIQALAEKLGRTQSDTETLLSALAGELTKSLSDLKTVAIPGFGSFSAGKENEHIAVDLSTGKRILMPPSIVVEFKPGSRLLKTVAQ